MKRIQFEEGGIYHIFNRGVEKRLIYLHDNDRWRFLQALFLFNDEKSSVNSLWELERSGKGLNFRIIKDFFEKNKLSRRPLVRLMADCLMPNHYHLMAQEIKPGGISKFMQKIGTGYAMYFNKKYDRVGGLFQGSFRALHIEENDHLKYLLVYINVLNPGQLIEPNLKEQGVVDIKKVLNFAKSFLWSTNREYLDLRQSIIIDKGILGEIFQTGDQYKRFLEAILPLRAKFESAKHLFLE